MLLEGFAEFHQRSVWHFASTSKLRSNEYIFPLITPSLMRAHEFTIESSKFPVTDSPYMAQPFVVDEGTITLDDGSKGIIHLLTPKSNTMALVNLMTASTEAHDALDKIKININLMDIAFCWPRHNPRYLENVKFDLSRFDRLAVHRQLRTFEVCVNLGTFARAKFPERLEEAMANLMVELEIVGKALIPDGVTALEGPTRGWSNVPDWEISGWRYFNCKVEKA